MKKNDISELIFYNGNILTMEEEKQNPSAVYIKDGIIQTVGTKEEVMAAAVTSPNGAEVIDLDGRTLMPSFIDSHGHFTGYANSILQVPLEEATTLEEISSRISNYIKSNHIQPGTWVIGKGYDQNILPQKRHPSKEVLDAAAPNHPVVIQHNSSHMGVLNSLALSKLNLTVESSCPQGGRIEIKDGELTGYLEEAAFTSYLQKVPMPSIEDLMNSYVKIQDRYAAFGITTVQEGLMPDALGRLYQKLLDQKLLKLDVVGYADCEKGQALFQQFSEQEYDRHFRLGGYKTFLDGSPQGRTAWMRKPYAGSNDKYCAYPTITKEKLYKQVLRAYEEGRQILAHCNGDAAAELYLNVLKEVQSEKKDTIKDIRPVMIHAQLLGKDQIPMVKECDVILSFFAAHVYHWGDVHIENFGMERASGISPAGSAKKAGICYTFHQDAPVIEPNMLETIWCATNRITKRGILLGEDERVSVLDALKAVTIHAARQYFEEKEKGSIKAGKRADFILLDQNPLETPKEDLRKIQVLETYKDGVKIY